MNNTIGIIGGLGPYAGIDVMQKVIDNTIAKDDREHLNTILVSFPNEVSDRTNYLVNNEGDNPAEGVIKIIEKLSTIGVNIIGIACNQMHAPVIWNIVKAAAEEMNISLISMVEELAKALYNDDRHKRIGIIGRTGTIEQEIYTKPLRSKGFDIYNHSQEWQQKIDDCIAHNDYGIKNFPNPVKENVIATTKEFLEHLKENNVSTVLIACTEIPLVLKAIKEEQIIFVDTSNILARALVRKADPKKIKQL